MPTYLHNHTSPETAYVVNDYPYGYVLRCKIRYWIETTKNGMRFCSQTTNPKRAETSWNKPKKSTYSTLMCMFLNDDGHVKFTGITKGWDDWSKCEGWIERTGIDTSNEYVKQAIFEIKVISKANSVLTCTIVSATGKTREELEESSRQSDEAKKSALRFGVASVLQEEKNV